MELSGWGGFGRNRGSLVPVVWAASAGGVGPVLRLLRHRCDGRAVADRGLPVAGAGSRLAANRAVGGRVLPAGAAHPFAADVRPSATAAHASGVAFSTSPAVAVWVFAGAVGVVPSVAVWVFAGAVGVVPSVAVHVFAAGVRVVSSVAVHVFAGAAHVVSSVAVRIFAAGVHVVSSVAVHVFAAAVRPVVHAADRVSAAP